jgi:hypothetical protein
MIIDVKALDEARFVSCIMHGRSTFISEVSMSHEMVYFTNS